MPRGKFIRPITIEDVEYLAHRLAREHLSFDEPIPEFGTRPAHRLESCLLTPFQTFAGKDLYPTLVDKAAILFYLMIKNHPFLNGNKRIAITTLQTFLWLNDRWLIAPPEDLYNLTVFVAMSPPALKKEMVGMIQKFVRENIVDSQTTPT
jgi:death-on-curing family protein